MFGKRKGRKAREEDAAASYEDTKNNMMSSAEERIMASKKLGEEQDAPVAEQAAPSREELLRATRPEKSDIQMMEFKDFVTVEDKLDPSQKAARDVAKLQMFDDPDGQYQYRLQADGDYQVFRDGKRTGTAKVGSRAHESIAKVQRGLEADKVMPKRPKFTPDPRRKGLPPETEATKKILSPTDKLMIENMIADGRLTPEMVSRLKGTL